MACLHGVNTARIDTCLCGLRALLVWRAVRPEPDRQCQGPTWGRATSLMPSWWWCWGRGQPGWRPVYAALGLGVLGKFLEGWTGAVLARSPVLVFIIIFIQKRPQASSR